MTPTPETSSLEVRVALAGLGTVGQAVVQLLQEERPRFQQTWGVNLRLVSIFDRSYGKKDTSWISPEVRFTESLKEFLETPSDVMVELIGGVDPANQIIRTGLQQRRAVVTANKILMARCGTDFLKLAAEMNSYLGFEASVAGGIPIIRVVQRSFFSDRILRVRGILNGTCNYILSEMADGGGEYEEALAHAHSLGYAESDPFLDVSGGDTTDKLAILGTLCFNMRISPDQIPTRGITEIVPVDFLYARRLDSTIKLLGVVERTGDVLSLRVSPFLIDNRLLLSKISGVLNALEITGATLGSVVISGKGAGGDPTAVSVVADILNAALWKRDTLVSNVGRTYPGELVPGVSIETGPFDQLAISQEKERYPFYIRFFVKDRPGIISALANILAERKINVDSVLQERWSDRSNLPFVITVEPTLFSTIQEAVDEMGKLEFNCAAPCALPMLR